MLNGEMVIDYDKTYKELYNSLNITDRLAENNPEYVEMRTDHYLEQYLSDIREEHPKIKISLKFKDIEPSQIIKPHTVERIGPDDIEFKLDRVVPYDKLVDNFAGIEVLYLYSSDGSRCRRVHIFYN
jgi:hypothetical protein